MHACMHTTTESCLSGICNAAVQINWDKIMWMEQAFGLKPWYLQGGSDPVAAPATPAQKVKPPMATALTPPVATA